MNKSTIAEIRARFDKDVERFSNLQTGQVSTMDADLSLSLIAEAASRLRPDATNVLDIGCGAGNLSLILLQKLPGLNCTLVDLSKPMLDKALERVGAATNGQIQVLQGNIGEMDFPANHYDIVLAGAVLHHLRGEEEWRKVFASLFTSLKQGGCLMISDLIAQENEIIEAMMTERYASYLAQLGGTAYARDVLAYIAKEDSPRSLNFQLDLLLEVGFRQTDVLHKNTCFATFCAVK